MGNAATELADLLKSLTVKNASIAERRGQLAHANPNTLDYWHFNRDAQRMLDRLEIALETAATAGVDVNPIMTALPEFYRTVWQPASQWETRQNASVDGNALEKLRLFASTLRLLQDQGDPPLTDADRVLRVINELGEIRILVEEIQTDGLAREHLLWQIDQAIRFASHVDHFGNTAVAQLVEDALVSADQFIGSEAVPDEARGKLRAAVNRATFSAFGKVSGAIASEAGKALFQIAVDSIQNSIQ